jgi:olfactory receptor
MSFINRSRTRETAPIILSFFSWELPIIQEWKWLYSLCFFLFILFILLTNLRMIIIIRINSQFHTPMYFFLSYLSVSDFCYSTAVGPKMLVDLLVKNRSIPFVGCALQLLSVSIFMDAECMLLAVMAFCRFKAISNPCSLLSTCPTRCVPCSWLVFTRWEWQMLLHTTLTFHIRFCGSNEINHFFSVIPFLSCILLLWYTVQWISNHHDFWVYCAQYHLGILVSYCYITSSVLKVCCTEGRIKAFLRGPLA